MPTYTIEETTEYEAAECDSTQQYYNAQARKLVFTRIANAIGDQPGAVSIKLTISTSRTRTTKKYRVTAEVTTEGDRNDNK